jgi:acetyltransferase
VEHSFLNPRSIALVGASNNPTKMGHYVLRNIIDGGYTGTIAPINSTAESVLTLPAYPRVSNLSFVPELVVVTTPAHTIPAIVEECAACGVPAMIIISAGFREVGEEGIALEKEIMRRKGSMRIAGPNCLGFMSPTHHLNATFASTMAKLGSVGVISQSGAILTALLDWAESTNVGFSQYISLGTMLDYGWHDALYTLGADPHTKSILIYMESVGAQPLEFVSAAREISAIKPIIVMKAGRSAEASHAAQSHTGAITGSDAVLDAIFERAGIVRVRTIEELFGMAELTQITPPRGNGLTIITNAGGPGVMAVDEWMTTSGSLTPLTEAALQAYSTVLPATWSKANPIDIIGDATPERYAQTLEIALAQPDTNAILVILSPQVMTDPAGVAHAIITAVRGARVPVFTSFMGGARIQEARTLLTAAGIPCFPYPEPACRMFGYVIERMRRQHMLYITPNDASDVYRVTPMNREVGKILLMYQHKGMYILTEQEAKEILTAYDIPTLPTYVASSVEDAVECANDIGYPVVLKLCSHTITHKSDNGGVHLDIETPEEVVRAFHAIERNYPHDFEGVTVQRFMHDGGTEIIIGSSTDAQLGPVITFGTGGKYVEVYQDVAMGFPPLSREIARTLMERTRVHKILAGYRSTTPESALANLETLERILVAFSRLVSEHGTSIREIEINPLFVSHEGIFAVDARVLLYEAESIPTPPAIRPYPIDWVYTARNKKNSEVVIRPIRPDDERRIGTFHKRLSNESVRARYLQTVPLKERQRHERLGPRCNIDYDRHMAFVAERDGEVIGVTRLIKAGDSRGAEFSLVVLDPYQNQGMGSILIRTCLSWARFVAKPEYVEAVTTRENHAMLHLLKRYGFRISGQGDDSTLIGLLKL